MKPCDFADFLFFLVVLGILDASLFRCFNLAVDWTQHAVSLLWGYLFSLCFFAVFLLAVCLMVAVGVGIGIFVLGDAKYCVSTCGKYVKSLHFAMAK